MAYKDGVFLYFTVHALSCVVFGGSPCTLLTTGQGGSSGFVQVDMCDP